MENLNKVFTCDDFPDVACSEVIDIMSSARELVIEKIRRQKALADGTMTEEEFDSLDSIDIDLNGFRIMLEIRLSVQTKEGVLAAISILEKQDEIDCVSTNFYLGVTKNDSIYIDEFANVFVNQNTSVSEFKKSFTIPGIILNSYVLVYRNDMQIDSGDLATGDIVRVMSFDSLIKEYDVFIRDDVNDDFNIDDILLLRDVIFGIKEMSPQDRINLCLDPNSPITIKSILYIRDLIFDII